MPIKHNFQSPVADVGIPPNLVKPNNWNEDHVLDGMLEQLDSIAVQPDSAPYIDAAGQGAFYLISAFMRSVMNSASIDALLGSLDAAPLDSPHFTGVPTAPTAATNNNTTQLATTAFVQAAIAALVASSPATLDTLNELAAALGNDPNFATTMTNALALKAPLNSPALTGTPTAPTAATGDASTKLATTAFVKTAVNRMTALAAAQNFDAVVTGGDYYTIDTAGTNTPVAGGHWYLEVEVYGADPTNYVMQRAVRLDNSTITVHVRSKTAGAWNAWKQVATTDSPTFTGDPKAPTPAVGDNDTSIATTAFVVAALNRAQAIANGTDFDTITTEGTYYNTGTCPNTPVAAGTFYLTVRKGNGTTNTSQMAVETTTGVAYVRVRSAGVWQAWAGVSFTPGQIPGTFNATAPGAGKVGERISSGATTNLVTGTPTMIAQITLTPGVWDLEMDGVFGGSGSTTSNDWVAVMSTTNGSIAAGIIKTWHERAPGGLDFSKMVSVARTRVAIAANTTYYLNVQATFSGGVFSFSGNIQGTRV